jgi:hypothetical protein
MSAFTKTFLLCLLVCHAICGFSHAASTYYISPAGSDRHSGLFPERAWRTLARANRVAFQPGDRILLEGGKTFRGPLKFDIHDGGVPDNPVLLGSYPDGEEKATISAGEGRGIDVFNTSGLRMAGLKIVGDGPDGNTQSGIILLSSKDTGAGHVWIEDVEVSGFGKYGISLGTWNTKTGYRDVRITRSSIHDNLRAGIFTWGPWGGAIYAHRGIYVGDCEVYNMKGGSGITLSSVDGGIVERCVAHNNGVEFSGAAGIWAWDSNNILLQFNESYRNRTIGVDGDGFDFDGGVTNSVMQYNYSHDNDAAGFLLAQYAFAPQPMKNIVIRYNISENDCRKLGYGAIHVWNGEDTHRISDVHIYQNTIYLAPPAGKQPAKFSSPLRAALKALGLVADAPNKRSAIAVISPTKSVSVHNNLFFTSGGEMLVSVVDDQEDIRFLNNAYWSDGQPFQVDWKGVLFKSFAAWMEAADDQERLGTRILALQADPMLAGPGTGGTLGNPNLLHSLTGYKLKSGSPLTRRGLNLALVFGLDPGRHGFFGTPISSETPPAIGANVVVGSPSQESDEVTNSTGIQEASSL